MPHCKEPVVLSDLVTDAQLAPSPRFTRQDRPRM